MKDVRHVPVIDHEEAHVIVGEQNVVQVVDVVEDEPKVDVVTNGGEVVVLLPPMGVNGGPGWRRWSVDESFGNEVRERHLDDRNGCFDGFGLF